MGLPWQISTPERLFWGPGWRCAFPRGASWLSGGPLITCSTHCEKKIMAVFPQRAGVSRRVAEAGLPGAPGVLGEHYCRVFVAALPSASVRRQANVPCVWRSSAVEQAPVGGGAAPRCTD